MKELDFQKELIMSAATRGGMGWIITDKFRKGRPDILIKIPGALMIIAECKLVKYVNPPIKIPVDTTALQKIEMRRLQRCEVIAPVLVCLLVDKRSPVCYTVWDIEATHIDLKEYDDYKVTRSDKRDWNISEIITKAEIGKDTYGITG